MSRSARNPIYQRGSSFYIRYSDANHKIRREAVTWLKLRQAGIVVEQGTKLAQPGRKLAEKLLTKRRSTADAGDKIPALHGRRVSFGELCDRAVLHVNAANRGAVTDRSRIGMLKDEFGNCDAGDMPVDKIADWMHGKKWSPATRNRYRACLSLIFRLEIKARAQRGDFRPLQNPARLLDHHKESRGRVRFLNQCRPLPTELECLKDCKDEESRLRAVIEKHYAWHREEFIISLYCGLRPSELYRLTWDRVDFQRKQIFLDQTKTGENRHVPLNSEALAAFKRLHARKVRRERVFLSEAGKPLESYRHWFGAAVAESGLVNFTWYALRHTFATRLVSSGVDLVTVKELMGHSTIAMTERYAHPVNSRAAVDKLLSEDFSGQSETDTNSDTALSVADRCELESVTIQ